MSTILITGSTDGIGLETAKNLAELGHQIILHGRNPVKLGAAADMVAAAKADSVAATVQADLTSFDEINTMIKVLADHDLDVVINNAGVLRTAKPITDDRLDSRFVVNTIAPYLLTRQLLTQLPVDGRVVNLSSAAQAPVDLEALAGKRHVGDQSAYAQSKLALTMWSKHLADELGSDGPVVVAVNPGSLLATNMVREGFGIAGSDIGIGVDILTRAAVSDEFADASGRYFDNDAHRFANPHPDALDPAKNAAVVAAIEAILSDVNA